MKIGILALQGDFHEHQICFNKLDVETQLVRSLSEFENCDSLVIPGGESTAISKLLISTKMDSAIVEKASEGFPIWGTCAGLILISNQIIENIPLAKFIGASMIGASFYYIGQEPFGTTTSVDFTNANLTDAVFEFTTIGKSTFKNTNLSGANFEKQCELSHSTFTDVDFNNASYNYSNFNYCFYDNALCKACNKRLLA